MPYPGKDFSEIKKMHQNIDIEKDIRSNRDIS